VSVAAEYGRDLSGYPRTNLERDYQRWNAATAALVARRLPPRWGISEEGMASALMRVDWPGRWQNIRVGGRRVVLDATHNPEGARMLAESLALLVAECGRKPAIVVGALGEARARAVLEAVECHASEIHLVVPQQARASSYEELESWLSPRGRAIARRATVAGIFPGPGACSLGPESDPVVVTGSIYLLGEVLARLEPGRGSGEGRLQDF
jgi:dihydrofolate synthase/folylpolyglutamate synthase